MTPDQWLALAGIVVPTGGAVAVELIKRWRRNPPPPSPGEDERQPKEPVHL